jgi:M6 family metalloprotease-like protein
VRERIVVSFMSRYAVFFSVAALLLFCAVPVALALEPPRPGELARLERQGKLEEALRRAKALGNYRLSPALLQHALQKAQRAELGLTAPIATPPSYWRGMPTTGSVRILTLLIDFPDYLHKNTIATINAKLFGDGTSANDFPYESLRNYYKRASYNQLDISGDILGWYRPAYARAVVTQTRAGREALIKEALSYYDAQGQDFSQYDNNRDGAIDYFVVVWTGPDNGWANFWWGCQPTFADTTFKLDGKSLSKYSWQGECRYSGGATDGVFDQIVVMHETGHALGLPDYYDYDTTKGPNGGVGYIDMMDGKWGDHNAFSKWILDWITPQIVTGAPQRVALAASGTSPQALLVMPSASASNPFSEYFIVQNRQRLGNDTLCATRPWYYNMPGDGLLVWHVDARLTPTVWGDDYLYNNSVTAHKLLRLMEADGLEHIETTSGTRTWPGGYAEAGDYYVGGKTFTDTSSPNSRKYDGSASNVAVTGISSPGPSMTFTAGVIGGVQIDTTSPTTTAALSPAPNGAGWHTTPVTATLTSSDDLSGVAATEYRLQGAATWTSYATPFAISALGTSVYEYRSRDVAGNTEATRSFAVQLDAQPAITRLSPASGKRGALVTISGTGFGASRGISSVKFGNKACTVFTSWSATQIKCRVPAKAPFGATKVTVATRAGTSNALSFKVKR